MGRLSVIALILVMPLFFGLSVCNAGIKPFIGISGDSQMPPKAEGKTKAKPKNQFFTRFEFEDIEEEGDGDDNDTTHTNYSFLDINAVDKWLFFAKHVVSEDQLRIVSVAALRDVGNGFGIGLKYTNFAKNVYVQTPAGEKTISLDYQKYGPIVRFVALFPKLKLFTMHELSYEFENEDDLDELDYMGMIATTFPRWNFKFQVKYNDTADTLVKKELRYATLSYNIYEIGVSPFITLEHTWFEPDSGSDYESDAVFIGIDWRF